MCKKLKSRLLLLFFFLFAFSSLGAAQNTEQGYCMPRTAPFYSAPPFQFRENKMITILFETTPEVIQALVPKPLVPNPDNLMFIYIGNLNIEPPAAVSYKEAGIAVPVSFSENPGNYAVYLYLDKTVPIVGGREIWGFPKKDADITFIKEGDKITAKVVRYGITLVNASLQLTERVEPIPSQPNPPWFNLKLIPSVKKNAPPDVMQLTSTLVNSASKELHKGKATLEFSSSPSDPLGKIKVIKIVNATYTVNDFLLDYGDVLYDYLAEGKK